ncbi:tRNA pseudouridine synthase A, putative [Bodo saltans]|uniref:tRNA pseudouridine synthase A, putative n=1 Tax=Bodo saltans TaxID=75058 RepID=A0A0S4IST3_BODSA|nr:tRNA pseudouridine synthase A, putative [Bodo saltans]|eukprot:CUG06200.1 tRNA pseudouridine synthase A, putative [Bodo saltans]
MEHVKAVPKHEDVEGDLRVKRIHNDTRGTNIDGLNPDAFGPSTLGPPTQRTFFDDGGMDIQGHGPSAPGERLKHRSMDILGLSGTSRQRDSVVDHSGMLESISPSDPTLVEEDANAYGNTPTELTDMLKERLLELKAVKLSEERDETVLRRRLALPQPAKVERTQPTPLELTPGGVVAESSRPQSRRRSATTLAEEYNINEAESRSSAQQELHHNALDAANQAQQKERREAVSAYLREEVPDLIPGMSSYDPFSSEHSQPDFSNPNARSSTAADGVLLLRCMQRACLTSRREAIELVASGEVLVDGVVERNPFRRVMATNNIKVRGHAERIRFAPSRLWVYHKPANVVVSRFDPAGRQLFTKHAQVLGIDHLIPIGSLPYKSHGLLLLTNDGELSEVLSHPRANLQQTYNFRISPAIDPVLANKLNTEGVRINEVLYKQAEFIVDASTRSRYFLKLRMKGEFMPPHQLLGHLNRTIERGGRVSMGPFALNGLPPGGVREVTVPHFFMKHVAQAWKPFVERDWPTHRRERVHKLKQLAKFRELRAKELEEMDAFTFDEFKDALTYQSRELDTEAERIASQLQRQPRVDDEELSVFASTPADDASRGSHNRWGGGQVPNPFSGRDHDFVEDITRAM